MASPDRRHRQVSALAMALAGLLAVLPARADEGPAPCGLVLTAEPRRLEASTPRAVRIRISPAGPGSSGSPPPRLSASVGRIEAPQAEGDGWVAGWRAPEAGIPRIAILGALASDGGACGFLAVPLEGIGDALVRTRPGATVEVRIGERTFGPVQADATGQALVAVEVAPGVDAVFHGSRRIPLPMPPVPHAALLVGEPPGSADQEIEVPLLLLAVTDQGLPRGGPAPALSAATGDFGPARPAGPGAWRVRWRLPPGPAGEVKLSARLPGEPSVMSSLHRSAGPPAVARLEVDPGPVVAGQTVTATVTLADAAGNAAEGDLEAQADAGVIGPAERLEVGRTRLTWTVPARLDGRGRAELTVRAGAAAARASVALRPGAPSILTLSAARPVVTADGIEEVDLTATVTDAHGNPVDEPPARRVAQAGTVESPRQVGPGRFTMVYRPRRASLPGEDVVEVGLPLLSARVRVGLRPTMAPFDLAASLGAAFGSGGWLGVHAGAEASAWRWLGEQEVGLALAASFTRLRDDGSVPGGAGPVAFSGEVRTLALLASVGWRRSAGQRLALRFTAGGGLGRVESLVAAGGGPLVPEASWVPAVSGAASVGWRLGPGHGFLETRAIWMADPGLASIQGTIARLALSLGYELDVP